MNRGLLAAAIHRRMVDDDRFGYSWEERFGADGETWTVLGHTFSMSVGDYDCSSSAITAWRKAIIGTPFEGVLDAATFTGNMRSVFTASGLFEWKPMSFLAEPGDLYLCEEHHVAMCFTQEPDVLTEFCWGDVGAYGNRRGDQSGYEAYAHAYYDYPWDGILHYNGKADGAASPAATVNQQKEEDVLPFAFLCQPDERSEMWYFDGSVIHRLAHPDQMKAIQHVYKTATGRDIPCFKLGTKKAPWAARLAQAFEIRNARSGALADEYKVVG